MKYSLWHYHFKVFQTLLFQFIESNVLIFILQLSTRLKLNSLACVIMTLAQGNCVHNHANSSCLQAEFNWKQTLISCFMQRIPSVDHDAISRLKLRKKKLDFPE